MKADTATPYEPDLDLDTDEPDPLSMIAHAIFDLASAVREHTALIHSLNCDCGGERDARDQRGH